MECTTVLWWWCKESYIWFCLISSRWCRRRKTCGMRWQSAEHMAVTARREESGIVALHLLPPDEDLQVIRVLPFEAGVWANCCDRTHYKSAAEAGCHVVAHREFTMECAWGTTSVIYATTGRWIIDWSRSTLFHLPPCYLGELLLPSRRIRGRNKCVIFLRDIPFVFNAYLQNASQSYGVPTIAEFGKFIRNHTV